MISLSNRTKTDGNQAMKRAYTILTLLLAAGKTSPLFAATTPVPVVIVPDVTCQENVTPCNLIITKERAKSYTQLRVSSIDGTAKAGLDFTGFSKSFTMGNNVTSYSLPMTILDNSTYQGSRTFGIKVEILRFGQLKATYVPPLVTINDNETQPPPTVTWTHCANENATCYIIGTADVRYGKDPTWSQPKRVTDSINCSNAIWGDPLPNVLKECQTNGQVGTEPTPPPTHTCPDGSVIPADQPCPVTPPPTQNGQEVFIPDNFDTAGGTDWTYYTSSVTAPGAPAGRGGIAPSSSDSVGAFRMFCHPGVIAKIDPMVYPGAESPHWHQFVGDLGVVSTSNYASLRTTGETTCGNWGDSIHPLNRSVYWFPAVRDGVNWLKPDYMNLYYKRMPASDPLCQKSPADGGVGFCSDLPNGIRYVFGYNMKTMTGGPGDLNSGDKWFMHFECWGSYDGKVSNNGVTGSYNDVGTMMAAGCPIGARLMIIAAAPNCWDGLAPDSADHRSHMSYGTGPNYPGEFFRACPVDHPYVIPNLEVQIAYTIDDNIKNGAAMLDSDYQMIQAGFPVKPFSTWHMDYWEAWGDIKAQWIQTCIRDKRTCGGGDLGNGHQINNADHYPDSAYPIHQLVPMSSLP